MLYKKQNTTIKKSDSRIRPLSVLAVSVFAVAGSISGPVFAETLNNALITTYIKNPTLNAQRAQQRAVDEGVSIARSGFRPVVTASGDATYEKDNDGESKPYGYSVTLTQPVFKGFRTINSVRKAEADVLAGREDLRGVEQTIFLQTVTAYVDVVRDQAIVRLRQNNVKVLTKQLRATQDRKDVGEVTITDVAQARARKSGAVSQLSLAKANLASSAAVYQRLVGRTPVSLKHPNYMIRYVPKSLKTALQIGDAENPSVLGAVYREQSAKHSINVVRGELLPEVNLDASYSRRYNSVSDGDETETSSVTGRVSVPIYQAGNVSARIRQAKQTNIQRLQQIEEARIKTKADIIAAWGRWEAAKAQLTSDRAQVKANRTALNGVRAQEKEGERTVLDVLDAEQELLDSQVALTTTKRDLVVAGYSVLSAIGRLSASDLGLSVPVYDSARYYDKVKGKWFGFGKAVGSYE